MWKRIITSLVGLPLLVAVVVAGGYWLQVCVAVLSLVGLSELFTAVSGRRQKVHLVGYAFALLYAAMPPDLAVRFFFMLSAVFILALLICMLRFHEETSLTDVLATAFGFFYVPFLMCFTVLVRNYEFGVFFVWLIFISAWGSDTFAYFTGITFGRHKLCPKLSPGKTVEGAVGGVVGATLSGALYGWVVTFLYPVNDMDIVPLFAVICAVGAVFSQLGDLSASAIKRYTGVKDFGSVIPGHGGVLDRFDSLLFTAPGVYFVMVLLLKHL